jgi:hypothetical protein
MLSTSGLASEVVVLVVASEGLPDRWPTIVRVDEYSTA